MSAAVSSQQVQQEQNAADRRAILRETLPGLLFGLSILGMALAVGVWFVVTRLQGGG